jgi:tRNA threonylcarbamoyladenosine biosynthesis protein TsaE
MVDAMSIITRSAQETRRLGEALGHLLRPGDVILLSGDLGAGKTTFSQGVARGVGVSEPVTSPTFVLAAEYEGRIRLVHMDLYRLHGDSNADGENPRPTGGTFSLAEALAAAGWEDGEGDGAALLIEWPGEVADEFDDALLIHIERAPLPRVDERVFRSRATGARSWTLLDEWVKRWLF